MGKNNKPTGIVCPDCGCKDFQDEMGRPWGIYKTIPLAGTIRRYRICRYCGKRIRTREKIEDGG